MGDPLTFVLPAALTLGGRYEVQAPISSGAMGAVYRAIDTQTGDAVAIFSSALSPTHWKTAVGECAEGAALAGLGHYADAESLLRHGLGILNKDPDAPAAYRRLGEHYLAQLHERQARAQAGRGSAPAIVTVQPPAAGPRVLP